MFCVIIGDVMCGAMFGAVVAGLLVVSIISKEGPVAGWYAVYINSQAGPVAGWLVVNINSQAGQLVGRLAGPPESLD